MSVVALKTVDLDRVKWGVQIPASDPVEGVNERCIELPLGLELAQMQTPGLVLDAGCALLPAIQALPRDALQMARVVHLTQNIGSEICKPRGRMASYISADLRDLSMFSDQAFDRIVCLSTLEHIGLDNEQYGGSLETAPMSVKAAIRELRRVMKHEALITVPVYVEPYANPRWRYFSPGQITKFFGEARYYVTTGSGWYGGATTPYSFQAEPPTDPRQIACIRWTR